MSTDVKDENYYWVGIGASAGGLEAIQDLCESLPDNANMIYIVAQHLSPKHESKLTELIQRGTSVKVETVVSGVEAKPNVIYITPPQKDVYVDGDKIFLKEVDEPSKPKPSVNNLFVSLAEMKKEHAIGVILSGTGSDGAHGIKTIKASGGCTYAQTPESATYDGMPKAAEDTDCVDFLLSAAEIGSHLAHFSTQLPKALRLKVEAEETQDTFSELVKIVRKQCGVSFKQYKKATLQRRIERRMLAVGVSNFEEYVDLLKSSTDEVQLLYKDILISVTNFFRDPSTFKEIEGVLESIGKSKENNDPIRIWVVGCATGEEAYSLAILLVEMLGGLEKLDESDHQIFATDVDTNALGVARRGIYNEASMADVPAKYREKYFKKSGQQYEVINELKRLILFSGHNIIDDPPFMRVDLITCRNLLIYFEQELQKKVYRIFHYSLRNKGYLFLGKSESTAQVTDIFRAVKAQARIFQKRSVNSYNPQRFFLSGKSSVIEQHVSRSSREFDKTPTLPETLIEQFSEASILINDNLDVEHIYGNSDYYLKLNKGKPSLNLCEIVIETFKHEVRPLVFKALRTKAAANGQLRKLTIDGAHYRVKMTVYPVQVDENNERFLLVCFSRENEVVSESEIQMYDSKDLKIKELEDELAMAREHIQTVIEELETSNEELQSMNEELQSSNEELQSSNEELETTNEELQSTNEELVTMNDELNEKTTELEQVSTQLSNIKNSLAFPLVYIDHNLKALRANKAAKEFFSLYDNLANFPARFTTLFPSTDLKSLVGKVEGTDEVEKVQLQCGDEYFWLHVTGYSKTEQSTDGAILSFVNNSELIKQRQEALKSREVAQQASMAKSEFLANVSHEIRTPLNAIVGVNEVFSLQVDDEAKRKRLLEILSSATNNLKNLLNDLLDFAKLEAGQLSLEFTSFRLRNLIEDLLDVYSVELEKKNLSVSTTFAKQMPEEFLGDPLRIQQVVSNLLSNAIKFTDEGKIEIKAAGKWKHEHYLLVLEIADTGIGMSDENISRVFEKFTQADSSISRRFGGSGLGLSIVKELVDLMSGSIDVKSQEAMGTTFTVSLPLHVPSGQTNSIDRAAEAHVSFKYTGDEKVLIVEDNDSNIYILSSYLDNIGVKYDIANNADEALKRADKHNYAIIFLDLQMDGMDGFEFYERFKQSNGASSVEDTRVIAVSAHVHNDIIQRCHDVGMDNYLPKPIEMKALCKMIQKYLDLTREHN